MQLVRVMPAIVEQCQMAMALLDLKYGRGDCQASHTTLDKPTTDILQRWGSNSSMSDVIRHVFDLPVCARIQTGSDVVARWGKSQGNPYRRGSRSNHARHRRRGASLCDLDKHWRNASWDATVAYDSKTRPVVFTEAKAVLVQLLGDFDHMTRAAGKLYTIMERKAKRPVQDRQ